MRIAVVNTQAPFVTGGAELHAQNLITALRNAGHQAELVTIPFNPSTAELIVDQAVAAAGFDINSFFENRVDLMIGLRFPAYLIRHDNKVLWLIHQYREAYDLWQDGGLRPQPAGDRVRRMITEIDTRAISRARKVFTNSKNVADRLKRYNGIEGEPLYHPPPVEPVNGEKEYGDYFYYPSRLSGLKRQLLCLEALKHCTQPVRIVFTGAADNQPTERAFRQKVEELDLGDRIEWRGFVDDDERTDLMERARAILFTPLDEDLGYITLEAMAGGKAVVTTRDSGGPLEFVDDDVTGFVAEPTAEALSQCFDRLWQDPDLAARMGAAGKAKYARLDIAWDNVVARLTGET